MTSALFALVMLSAISPDRASAAESILGSSPPERCAGYGTLRSISLTDWEAGLGQWTAGTRNITDGAVFATPDWAVTGGLPDSKAGLAAFVPNLNIGNCADNDQSGVLTLTSPQILIPGDVIVPRISIDHWFDIFNEYDGGNLRISVNGGSYNLIPASAIEMSPYQGTLVPALDPDGFPDNTNPLAGQEAFTGTYNDQPTGSWVQSRINLLGIADAGNSITLRFDFGIDGCVGAIGWYVDEVEFYDCPDEPVPSDCGNGVIDVDEVCDDGNDFIGDGCSNTCQIESGWQCAAPTSSAVVPDYSFEDGTPNSFWEEVSNNPIGTPICSVSVCGKAGGTGPAEGTYWVNLGSVTAGQEGSVSQSIVIPSTVNTLTFQLEIPSCDSPADFFEVLIDHNQVLLVDGSSPHCDMVGYQTQTVDIGAYADDGVHDLEFHSITVSANGDVSSFFIDEIGLPGKPSVCRRIGTHLTLINNVISDDGGMASASAWTLAWSGTANLSGPGPILTSAVTAGTYNLAQSGGPSGYSASDWDCNGGTQLDADTVIVGVNQDVTCTITNDDIAPTLTVLKTIINDHGGLITDPNAFNLEIDGEAVLHNSPTVVDFGDHTVSESTLAGYLPGTWDGDCGPEGDITLALGQNAVCSIVNADIGLSLVKQVINDNGGDAGPDEWTLSASGPVLFSGPGPKVSSPAPFVAGSYVLSESGGPAGYSSGNWNCTGDGSLVGDTIALAPGESATCTIINDDISPTLTVEKNIDNSDGGTITDPNLFGLMVDGLPVMDRVAYELDAGVYTVSETGQVGYTPGPWGGDCDAVGNITLALAQNAICTITNDDIPSADLSITKTDGQTSGMPGGDTTYTIVVSNAGPSTVSDANVTDMFRAVLNCSYTSLASGGASGNTASGSGSIDDTLVLPPGSSVSYTAPCNIDGEATGTLSNTASVTSGVADPNPGNESATDMTNLTASADLSITKTDGQTSGTPGGNTTYSIVVNNAGPSTVIDANVTDIFGADLVCTYTSLATGGASGNTANGSGYINDTLVLPAGASVTYTAPCNIDGIAMGTLSNTASISSGVMDPNPGNESATDTTNLTASADLSISKTDGQTSGASGGTTTYTIVVSNAGPSTVSDASVTDVFSADLSCAYTSVAGGGASGNTTSGSGNISDTLVLPAGGSVTYTAPCDIDPEATGTLSNTASVSSGVPDPSPGNNSATDTNSLVASANLSISKTDGLTTANPGGLTLYTITVRNFGPSNVSEANVTDSFSSDLSCSYTSVPANGASGNTAAGSGDIADTLVLPAGSFVIYIATCNIDQGASGMLTNTAAVGSAIPDPNPGNNTATDTTNLIASADLLISKTDGTTSAAPGGSTSYTIVVNNAGPSDVSAANVTDIFSPELSCTYTSVASGGASGNTAAGSNNISDILNLPAGSSVTYTVPCNIDAEATGTLSNTASVSSAVPDPNPSNQSATDFTNLTDMADLSISKTDGLSSATPGGGTTYTIVASNAGPSTVSDANVTDSFSADLSCTYTSVAAGGATGNTAASSGNIADTLLLPAGGSVTYTANCGISSGATGTLSNTATVSSVVPDPNPGNESATDTTNLIASADLSIGKTDGQTSAMPGSNTTYTIVVSNAGPSDVNSASVSDSFVSDLTCTYTSVAAGGASGNTDAGSGNIADALMLPAGGSVTYTALCSISLSAAGTLSNTATVSSGVPDPNPGNDSATDNTTVVASADLSISKTDGQTSATPGGNTTYTIVVANAGPSTVNDAHISDMFVANLNCTYTSVAAGGASGNSTSGSGNIADTLTLPAGGSVTYTAPCDIDGEATGTLSNTATVNSAVVDPSPGNESATDTTNLTASADLSITKSDGQTTATPGGTTTYTIVVSNAGPSTVSDANVTDTFVADLSCTYTSVAAGGASGNTTAGSSNMSDTLTLPAGGSVTYTVPCAIDGEATGTLSNTAIVSSAVTDPNPGNESATDNTNLTASADLSISKTDGQASATPGGNTTYTIVVSNAGPSTVSDAHISDMFVADLNCTYTSVAAGGASGNTASDSGNISDTLTMPSGSSVTYSAPCDIDSEATGTLSNTASVSSVVADPSPGDESATDTTDLAASADLSITKTDGQTSATPGGNTTYTIVVANAGPSTVSDANVADTFVSDLSCSYTSVAAGGASGNTAAGSGNIADTLTLPAGGSVTYTAPCDIDAEATGTLSNTASVSSAVTDPGPGNESATDTTNLTASADLSITKSDGRTAATPGLNTTYTIVVSNAGPSSVSDANVTDTFVADLSCTYTSVAAGGASGNTASSSGNINDTLVLPVGASVTYTAPCEIDSDATGTVSNTATLTSAVADPNPGNESATDTTNLTATANLSVSKTDGQTSGTPGGNTTYTIVVSNAGPSTVGDANLTDTFVANLTCTYTSVAAGGASGNTASGSGNINDTLTMPAGSSVTYTAPCDINAEATGTLSNTASVSSTVADPGPGNESATDTTNLTASADLSITKSDGQTTATPGGTTTYTIVVSNAGPSTVSDAQVSDIFVADLSCTYTSATADGATGNTATGSGNISDTLVLPVGGSVTYTAPCDIDAEATGTLSNTASVSSAVTDPSPGNESSTDTTNLTASADLSITKTNGQTSGTPGGNTTYTIVVSNAGPSTVSDANLTDTFVADLTCTYTSVAADGASGNTASASGNINDSLVLPVGSSVTYTAPCDIDAEATGTLSNTASVSSAVTDPNPGDESATDTTNLTASADLTITKSDGQTSSTPGGETTYTIVVSNAGPSAVSDANVTDTFIADLTCDYTSVAAGGASGNTASGSGNINDTLTMPAGSSVTYSVPCDINAEATGTLSNTANVSSVVTDPNPGDESATDTTNLTASADLTITKTDGETSGTPGGTTTYTIVVSNAGPSAVSDANVTDTFIADLTCDYTSVAAGGASGNTASGSGNINDTLTMPAGSSVTYSAPCDIDAEATETLSNTANVSSVVTDPNPGDESATDTTNLTASADLSITKSDGQTSGTPGGTTTYTIVVSNAGPSTVSDANVTDTFAAELDCTYTSVAADGSSGNTESGSGNINDTLELPAGGSVTYTAPCDIDAEATGTLSNTATVSSVVTDLNPGDESATDTTNLTASADLSITKTDGQTSGTPGGDTTYTIVVSNAGPSDVSDANVTDIFAADLDCTYTSVAADGASGNTASGSGNIDDTLELPAGGSVTYTAPCDIDAEATGTLSNTATVSSEVTDLNPGDESATDTTNLTASADLSITKTDGQTSGTPGGDTTYTIVVSNAGPSEVSDANVTDIFAADLDCTYTSVAAAGASGNTASGSGNIDDTLTLPSGGSVTYTVPCDIDAEATGTLSNTASVSSVVTDPNPGDESATDSTNLTASADLSITNSDGQTSASPGGDTTYTIVVSNAGPSEVSDANVTDTFATELDCTYTSVAADGASGNTASGSGDINDTLNMPSGSSVTYTVPCDIDAEATGALSNTAAVSSVVTDPNPGDESATDTTNLLASADLSISKTDGLTSLSPGSATTYTIVVSNAGPSNVSDANVIDNFAADLTCTYTSVAAGGASGNTASSSGNIADTLILPAGSSVTYTVPCDIDPEAEIGNLSNTATVTSTVNDPNPGDESATDNTLISNDIIFSDSFES